MHPTPHQQTILSQAGQAMAKGDMVTALGLFDQSDRLGRTHQSALSRALALKILGRLPEALNAMDEALQFQPYDFAALLAKGSILEQARQPKLALDVYKNALKIGPSRERCPPALLPQMDYAAKKVSDLSQAMADYLQTRLRPLMTDLDTQGRERLEEGMAIFSGLTKPVVQEPLLLHYPQLPPISFYDRAHFPWLERLEAATPVIVEELTRLLENDFDQFAPYIAYPKGAPVNQWRELNHSKKWTSLFLWNNGAKNEAVCKACPQTTALLESLPMAEQDSLAPTAMFSALQPHTHIPAHTGSSNVRLLTHLPLILPGPARFRVGNQTRTWEMGKAWVFDDTIEHEAWNDADGLRVILIFDVWNPYLSEAERPLVTEMMKARRDFMES